MNGGGEDGILVDAYARPKTSSTSRTSFASACTSCCVLLWELSFSLRPQLAAAAALGTRCD